jgi:hypothetical protein
VVDAYPMPGPFSNEVYLVAVINGSNSLSTWSTVSPLGNIQVEASKAVVPIMYTLMAINSDPLITAGTWPTIANLQLPFYALQEEFIKTGGGVFKNLNCMSKVAPCVEMIESDPLTNTQVYDCKYGQAVLANEDFIETQGGVAFIYTQSQANAYTNYANSFIMPNAGRIQSVITFLYFELQK